MLKILQSRLVSTVDSMKRGTESKEGSRESRRDFKHYPDGKRNKKINEAVTFRNNAIGFNDCLDKKKSDIRIACTIFNMNRDVSTIAPMMNGMKENKVIVISHFVLFVLATAPTQKGQSDCPQINNDNIVHSVSTVILKK